jgi:hypothetical protein
MKTGPLGVVSPADRIKVDAPNLSAPQGVARTPASGEVANAPAVSAAQTAIPQSAGPTVECTATHEANAAPPRAPRDASRDRVGVLVGPPRLRPAGSRRRGLFAILALFVARMLTSRWAA